MDVLKLADCARKRTSWRGPNSFILGVPPSPRDCHGLATVLGNLYVFGGNSGTGGNIPFTTQVHKDKDVDQSEHDGERSYTKFKKRNFAF